MTDDIVGVTQEDDAVDVERDIRIAIWNAAMNGGMGQDLSQAFIRRAMDEPTMKRALARLASEARSSSSGEELPADVRRLVVAARRALEATDWASNDRERRERLRTLDQASEAFASRVPWDDAPAETSVFDLLEALTEALFLPHERLSNDLSACFSRGTGGVDVAEIVGVLISALDARSSSSGEVERHRFGSPPEPVVNPNEAWCDAYADWYYQGRG